MVVKIYGLILFNRAYHVPENIVKSKEEIKIRDLAFLPLLFQFFLGFIFDCSNIRHSQAMPFINPAKNFTMEFGKEARVLLKSVMQTYVITTYCVSISFNHVLKTKPFEMNSH